MIPAAFDYYRPKDMAGVLSILEEHGDDARVMAGGHSLIPMMKLRMADVPHLIDLQDVGGMSDIAIGADKIVIGAMVTQAQIIDHAELGTKAPILSEAALQIADPQVRYMGTVGGNVANGDPGNDMPGLMQCLDATFTVVGPDGERDIAARDFYEAAYMTAREDDEVLTRVTIPLPSGGYAYEKQKRKIGDYATAAAAVQITKDGGNCTSASIAMTNLSDVPVYSEGASAALVGTTVDDAAIKAAIDAMLGDIDPVEDNRGPIAFKNHVAGVILRRAITRAWSRA
ncbi:xanthine dehydrogenase family protein subunit M [Loktanella sp. D2R18]|uniref:FAD binding domain-containing protein n=1 Tax=Rhodobacterales TaxID=204455 RepID=UPI000DEB963B|nr:MULTISPECIES: xanthine dehydrogenase family protein subunit M [Rhodobacterales]MDO6589364.1 xanthine dehydrogenase family protein subunit M [Yoonia sp. 1_MG-2023]RBW45223.1 xanthine dehydrogenase family protein subunit M [Loktanella sp. D2R18]